MATEVGWHHGASNEKTAPTPLPSATLRRSRWTVVRGGAAIVFGIVAIALPGATLVSLVLLFSAFLFVDGWVSIASALAEGREAGRPLRRWPLWQGAANIALGVIAFLWPGLTLIVLVWLSAFWAAIAGALMLRSAFRSTAGRGSWLRGLAGAVSIAWAILLLVAPAAGAIVMTHWVGAYAIVFGIVLLGHARQRRVPGLP